MYTALSSMKYQGEAVDEADEVRAPVVGGRAQACDLQFADGEKAVIGDAVDGEVLKVDDAGPLGVKLAARVAIADGNAVADQAIKVSIVLEQRAGEIVLGKLGDGVVYGRGGKMGVEAPEGFSKVAGEHNLAGVGAAQRSGETKGFLVPGVDVFPAEPLFEVFRERGLNQTVFAVNVRNHAFR